MLSYKGRSLIWICHWLSLKVRNLSSTVRKYQSIPKSSLCPILTTFKSEGLPDQDPQTLQDTTEPGHVSVFKSTMMSDPDPGLLQTTTTMVDPLKAAADLPYQGTAATSQDVLRHLLPAINNAPTGTTTTPPTSVNNNYTETEVHHHPIIMVCNVDHLVRDLTTEMKSQ